MSSRAKKRNANRMAYKPKDLHNGSAAMTPEAAYDKGYKQGYKDGVTSVYAALYAGVCEAANELYGFGEQRCFKLIKRADEIVLNRLTNNELCDEVYERIGLQIIDDEPFDRVVQTR